MKRNCRKLTLTFKSAMPAQIGYRNEYNGIFNTNPTNCIWNGVVCVCVLSSHPVHCNMTLQVAYVRLQFAIVRFQLCMTTQLNWMLSLILLCQQKETRIFYSTFSFRLVSLGVALLSFFVWRMLAIPPSPGDGCMSVSRHTHSHIRAAALCLCLRWQTRTSHGKSKLTWREFEIVCQYV